MIEPIGNGKTSLALWACKLGIKIWTRSADHHTGRRPLEASQRKA